MTSEPIPCVAEALAVLQRGREALRAQLDSIEDAIAALAGDEEGPEPREKVRAGRKRPRINAGDPEAPPPAAALPKRRGPPPKNRDTSTDTSTPPAPAAASEPPVRKKRQISPEGLERIRAGVRKRWAGKGRKAKGAKGAAPARADDEPDAAVEASAPDRPASAPATPRLVTPEQFAAELDARGVEKQAAAAKRIGRMSAEQRQLLADYQARQAQLEQERAGAASAPAPPADPTRFEARSRFRRDGDEETRGPIQHAVRPGLARDDTPTLVTAFDSKPERAGRGGTTTDEDDADEAAADHPWRSGMPKTPRNSGRMKRAGAA